MQSLKVYFLSSKISATYLQRSIQTSSHLLVRSRKINPKPGDVGLKHQKNLYDDTEFLEELDDEGNLESEGLNLMNSHVAYDENYKDKMLQQKKTKHKIIEKKFFKPPPQPLMLTYNEKQCIKYLHKEDPELWNVHALSESFPATPVTIKKILKRTIKFSPETIAKMDKKVQSNWELLAKGQLEAEPYVLNHLKKFLNRRDALKQINESHLQLSEPEPEPIWNAGEMTSILSSYEKAIKELENVDSKSLDNKAMTSGSDSEEKKSSLDALHEQIQLEKSARKVQGKESFLLGETVKSFGQPVTFEELEENIMNKAEYMENLNLSEKAILESKLKSNVNTHNGDLKMQSFSAETDNVKDSLTVQEAQPLAGKYNKINKNILKMEERVAHFGKSHKFDKMSEKYFTNEPRSIPMPDERTVMLTEENCGESLKLENVSEPKLEVKNSEKPVVKEPRPDFLADPVRQERDEIYYKAMENDIKETPFWNSGRTSKEKSLLEFEKADMGGPKERHKITLPDVCSNDVYPERIKIPKSKRGSGLTFKANDCYYDDDGEFLYRVPGLK